MTVKERLKKYLSYKGVNDRTFCLLIGVSTSYINSMRVSIQPDKILSIAEHFPDLNMGWLMTGEGEMLKNSNVVAESSEIYHKADKLVSQDEKFSMLTNLIKQNGELISANKALAEANRQLSEANNRQTKMLETLIEAPPPLEIERSSKVG